MGLGDLGDKAKGFADDHDEQVDKGAEKAGDFADDKTGGKHSDKIDSGVDKAQDATGSN